jgi:hypothetical protein
MGAEVQGRFSRATTQSLSTPEDPKTGAGYLYFGFFF